MLTALPVISFMASTPRGDTFALVREFSDGTVIHLLRQAESSANAGHEKSTILHFESERSCELGRRCGWAERKNLLTVALAESGQGFIVFIQNRASINPSQDESEARRRHTQFHGFSG
jgi:hypothetical protein